MTSYNFKSSGKTTVQREVERLESVLQPIGIKTPLTLGSSGNIFSMTTSLIEQISDNFRNLLMTNKGERLGICDYGANLRPLATEFTNQDNFDLYAMERIKAAITKWMPYIELDQFESNVNRVDNVNTAIIDIMITYNVPALNVRDKKIKVSIHVI